MLSTEAGRGVMSHALRRMLPPDGLNGVAGSYPSGMRPRLARCSSQRLGSVVLFARGAPLAPQVSKSPKTECTEGRERLPLIAIISACFR